jgi:diguanylate cyclase (GGDEF)-like protein/PAS domain S-box-containing protein
MKQKKRVAKHVDSFLILFVFFLFLLSALFYYLLESDRHIRNYDTYRQSLQKMTDLEHRWEKIFLQKYHYIDHDESRALSQALNNEIVFLENSALREEFGESVYDDLMRVKEAFVGKDELFLQFESLNANLTNSIHTMYDLKKSFDDKYLEDRSKRELVNALFFKVGQIFMEMPYEREKFRKLITSLRKYANKDRHLGYLYLHMKNFAENIQRLDHILKENSAIDLAGEILHLSNVLNVRYSKVRQSHKMVAIGFFLLALLMLILLIYNYNRLKRSTKELLAFRYAIEKSDNAVVVTNAKREIEYVNEAFEKRSGYTKDEVLGHNPNILKSDLLSDDFYRELNETLDRGEIWQGELINKRKDGSLLYEKASIIPVYIDGVLVQYLAVKLDITEYKEQQQRLKQAAAVYEMIGDGILVTDKEKRIISVNPAFVQMFGYSEAELLGGEPMIIRTLKEDSYFYKQMWDQLLSQDRWSGKLYNQTKEGTVLPIWLTLTVVRDEKGEIENFIAIYTNLQEIIATQERAEYLAYHDSLTGLPNRAYFDLRIVDILDLARSSGEQVAILFLDLDRFKVINDTLGHSVGDGMLVELSKRIQMLFDDNVLFARMGGDEFVVTLVVENGKYEVQQIAEKILSTIREPIRVYDYYLNTTASIGIALFPDDAIEKQEIIKYADSAMYAAKEKGKDTYQFYTRQLSLTAQKRLTLEQELKHAVERNELILHYQPQYLLEKRNVVGAEALLRWHSHTLGYIPPDEFISVAEETGMIIGIGYFVFEEACRAFMRWKENSYALESISINVSTVQFRDEHFLQKVEEIFQKTGIDPSFVEIEITERFIMEYSTANLTVLEDLRRLGCRISIDDFGTGYSSMSYMKKLPLDTIKIDRSFISELPENAHDMEVTKAIIALSKSLGYQVVAEGIENKAQESFLHRYGCDLGQGYYFAKPMEETAFIHFLDQKNTNFTV